MAEVKTKKITKYNFGKLNWCFLLAGTILSWLMIAMLILSQIVKGNKPISIIFWVSLGFTIFFAIYNAVWLIAKSNGKGLLTALGIVNIFLPFVSGTYLLTISRP